MSTKGGGGGYKNFQNLVNLVYGCPNEWKISNIKINWTHHSLEHFVSQPRDGRWITAKTKEKYENLSSIKLRLWIS